MMRGTFLCCFPNARRAKFGKMGSSFYIAKRERGLDRLAELVGLAGVGSGGFPKFQCSLCHDCIRNKVSQIGLIGLIGKPDGGAVMAPLRRAGLTGSLLFQGDRSDLGLRGREGCRAGLPFRSALLRAEDREAGRGRGWATGAMGDGSRW